MTAVPVPTAPVVPALSGSVALTGAMLAAVLLAAAAGWVAFGSVWPSRLRGAGMGRAGAPRSGPTEPGTDSGGSARRVALTAPSRVLLLTILLTGTLLAGGAAPLASALAGAVVVLVLRLRAARARRDAVAERRQAVIDTCVALAACLRGGAAPESALARASGESPALSALLGPVVTTARLGGDVPVALQRGAALPGAGGLRRVAACWQVGAANGAALADSLEKVTRGLRDDEAYRREVEAQLAGPRATARLLAVLPGFGIALGAATGANPVQVLVGTSVGAVCLTVGAALAVVGLLWMRRLAASAEPTW